MNKKISNMVLSLSAILALSACGTNNDYKAKNNVKGENPKVDISNPSENISNLKLEEDTSKKISWEKSDNDETVMGNTVSNNKFLSFSKWHNKLVSIDLSSNTKKEKLFLNVQGGRDTVDTSTGASEQVLSKVEISNDDKTIYSLITKYEDDSKGIGVGIYKTDISSDIPSIKFASISQGNNFYKNDKINDISLSDDGTKLLASSNDKEIYVFDTSNLTNQQSFINTSKTPKAIRISKDKNYAFVGLAKRNKNSLGIYDLISGDLKGEYQTSKLLPNLIVQLDNNMVFIASTEEKKIYKLDISDKTDIKLKNTYEVSDYIKDLSISKNKKYLFVSTNNKKLNILDIINKNKKTIINFPDIVHNAFSVETNKIGVSYGRTLSWYSLKEK